MDNYVHNRGVSNLSESAVSLGGLQQERNEFSTGGGVKYPENGWLECRYSEEEIDH